MKTLPTVLAAALATLALVEGPRAQTPPARPAAPRPPVEMLARTGPRLSNQQRTEQADRALSEMRAALGKVAEQRETARREKDIVRLNCVSDKLVPLKGLLRVAEQAATALQEAIAAKNDSAAHHEFTRIELARSKARQLEIEARSCIGESAIYTGPIQVEVDIDPSIPRRDPTILLDPPLDLDVLPPSVARPQALSPPM